MKEAIHKDPRVVALVEAGIVNVDPEPGETDDEASAAYTARILAVADAVDIGYGFAVVRVDAYTLRRFQKKVAKTGEDSERAAALVRRYLKLARVR